MILETLVAVVISIATLVITTLITQSLTVSMLAVLTVVPLTIYVYKWMKPATKETKNRVTKYKVH